MRVFANCPDHQRTECRLLLQCRAPEKITFPSLWTNTCCSHPLYPEECGNDGVLKAAKRKLFHELGIHAEQWNDSDFMQLDLMRYCAPCDDTWGENEGSDCTLRVCLIE